MAVAWNDPFLATQAAGMPFPWMTDAFRAGVRRIGGAPATGPAPERAGSGEFCVGASGEF